MAEKLIPLDLPPGLARNGTKYQQKGRWYDGNLVRFFQKTIQPVGGWVQRTLTGATITGTPNAAISWVLNDGSRWLAVGTTTGLFVVSSSNVVTDITPSSTGISTPWTWSLSTFGSLLIAAISTSTNSVNVFQWSGNTGADATVACLDALGLPAGEHTGPTGVHAVATTAERFLLLLRGGNLNQGGSALFLSPGGHDIAD